MQSSDNLHKRLSILAGKKWAVHKALEGATSRLSASAQRREDLESAQIIIQKVAQMTQDQLEYRVSQLTTCAMAAIFPRPYDMRVHFDAKRGRTECNLRFGLPGEETEIEPMDASGYGVVDVASFALRLSLLSLQRPRRRSCIVLDEPFKYVSKNYLPLVADLIHELNERLGIQFVIITHEERLIRQGDPVFRATISRGVSAVTREGEEKAAAVDAEGEYEW